MAWPAEQIWFKCEENAANTTVVDSSQNSYTSVATSNTSNLSTTGKISLGFDTHNLYSFKANSNVGMDVTDGVMSVAFWINPTSGGDLFSKGGRSGAGKMYSCYWAGALQPKFHAYDNSVGEWTVTTSPTMSSGAWSHLSITLDGSGLRTGVVIYINGSSVAVSLGGSNVTIKNFTNAFDFIFGNGFTGSNQNNAIYDDCRFFKATLTQAQVTALYNGGSGTQTSLPNLDPAAASSAKGAILGCMGIIQ